jgi:hypothetical protein
MNSWVSCSAVLSCLLLLNGWALESRHLAAQTPDTAQRRLQAAREALGGEARLKQIKTLILAGTWQQLDVGSGRLMPPKPYEVRLILPDHYLRLASSAFARLRAGFAGDRLIYEWKPGGPQVKMSIQVPDDQLSKEQAAGARLMLGLLAETQTALRLNAHAPSDARLSDTVDLSGPNGLAFALDLDGASHLPIRVRYRDLMSFPASGNTTQSGSTTVGTLPAPEPAEVTLSFEDRHQVEGVGLPSRVRQLARDVVFQDIRFEKISVNPSLSLQEFESDDSRPR